MKNMKRHGRSINAQATTTGLSYICVSQQSVCRSGLRVPIASSLLGGGVPIPEQRLYWTLDSVP